MSVSPVGASAAFAYAPASAPRSEAASSASATGRAGLSQDDLRVIGELQTRDRAVHSHEMAHMAAGAGLVTRSASYTYQTGPDGQRYAVGGEVGIDVSGAKPTLGCGQAMKKRGMAGTISPGTGTPSGSGMAPLQAPSTQAPLARSQVRPPWQSMSSVQRAGSTQTPA